MTEELHKAAQYLCCAGKSYLDRRQDDSHTNMDWDSRLSSLVTDLLGPYEEYSLALNVISYSLEFLDSDREVISAMHLEGANHLAIVNWIGEEAMRLEIGDLYAFELHYELPYDDFNEEYVFPEPDYNELERFTSQRNTVVEAINHLARTFEVEVDIRTWPHHFDTAAVVSLASSTPRSIAMGLAIPDTMVDEDYFYVSGWSSDESLILDQMPPLKYGEWMFPNWNGAVFRSGSAVEKEVMTFMIQAVQAIIARNELSY